MAELLQVRELTKRFGNLIAVNRVSFAMREGEILGLIGPNGAGKTTLFNTITGLYEPDSGEVCFRGSRISNLAPHKICRLGLSRTFQVTRAFESMRVEEAVRVGAYNRRGEGEVQAVVDQTLAFFNLKNFRTQKCRDLGLAPLKRVELARAAATEPSLLLLDEAGAGLNPRELVELMERLKRLRDQRGTALCVVEHVMQMVMGLCDRIIVLDYGQLIAQGSPQEIGRNPKVIEAYLGKRGLR